MLTTNGQPKEEVRQQLIHLMELADNEAGQLKSRTADLLNHVEKYCAAGRSADITEELVTRLHEANQNLVIAASGAQDLQGKAEATNRRQDEFLAMLAHELRNPLAPISMATELLGRITEAHPQIPKLHTILQRQIGNLVHMVNDLVDASRVNSGKIVLQTRAVFLSDVLASAIETSTPHIKRRFQHLTVDLPTSPIAVNADLVRLAQVFSNLLINATKFTQENGNINVSVSAVDNSVTVSIRDNGIGIAKEIQPFIFDLFRQGPSSLDRAQGGLGIGLALARSIVEMHCGKISVRSDGIGHGSEFLVEVPISDHPPNQGVKLPVKERPNVSSRVLLIEDNIDANETLRHFLEIDGHMVTSAFDGESAFTLAKANPHDVIICDIGLPGMDGYALAKALRAQLPDSCPCLIAISGYGGEDNKKRAAMAGFDHYLVKPILVESLANLIHQVAL
jgi:two-component system CheB/CheR fusion protein